MDDRLRIAQLLTDLHERIDPRGFVTDEALREQILHAHVDRGMEAGDRPCISLAPPASAEQIGDLEKIVKQMLGVDLPSDYTTFLGLHDGMYLGFLPEDDEDIAEGVEDQSYDDDAIMSTKAVISFLRAAKVEVKYPNGSVLVTNTGRAIPDEVPERPTFLARLALLFRARAGSTDASEGVRWVPFYSLGDVGYHAVSFSSAKRPQTCVVDVDHERMWEASGQERIAPSFAAWLDAFLRAGLEPFAAKALLEAGG